MQRTGGGPAIQGYTAIREPPPKTFYQTRLPLMQGVSQLEYVGIL